MEKGGGNAEIFNKIGTKTAENPGISVSNLFEILNPWKTGEKCRKKDQNGNQNCRKSRKVCLKFIKNLNKVQ